MSQKKTLLSPLLIAACFIILFGSCTKDKTISTERSVEPLKGKIMHHVSVGGADICLDLDGKPGCNANYSLVANMDADGNVTGQYQDAFLKGEGFHASVNCLTVVNNEAWVSGIVISGKLGDTDLKGYYVVTKVQDNGQTGDKISFSYLSSVPYDCNVKYDVAVYDLVGGAGQVKVW